MPWQRANPTVSKAKARWTFRNRFPSFLRNNPVVNVTSAKPGEHSPNGRMKEISEISDLLSCSPASSARTTLGKQDGNNSSTNIVIVVVENLIDRVFIRTTSFLSSLHYNSAPTSISSLASSSC